MYIFAEFLFIFVIIFYLRKIILANKNKFIFGTIHYILLLVLTSITYSLFYFFINLFTNNFIFLIILPIAIIIPFYFIAKYYILKFSQKKDYEDRLNNQLLSKKKIKFVMLTTIYSLLIILLFILFDLFLNLLSFSPIGDNLRNRTLFLKHYIRLIDSKQNTPFDNQKSNLNINEFNQDENLKNQDKFLKNIGNAFNKTRSFISEKTGTKEIIENVKVIKKIVSLNENQSKLLIESIPEIKSLLNNPNMLNVIQSDEIVSLIEEASFGSIDSLYKLSEHKIIINLMEDQQVKKIIKDLSLEYISKQIDKNYFESFKSEIYFNHYLYFELDFLHNIENPLIMMEKWAKVKITKNEFNLNINNRFLLIAVQIEVVNEMEALISVVSEYSTNLLIDKIRLSEFDQNMSIVQKFKKGKLDIVFLVHSSDQKNKPFKINFRFNETQ